MVTYKEHGPSIEEVKETIDTDSETHSIIHPDVGDGKLHGYVTEGEVPVACTKELQAELDTILRENGVIGGQTAIENPSDGPVHGYVELEPGDDGYIELLSDLLSWYVVDQQNE